MGGGWWICPEREHNALHKAEMVRTHGGFNGSADLEWATLLWVDWFNNRRLHGSIGMIPPSEFESNYYKQRELENRSSPGIPLR
jgi:putative transposase